MGFVDSKASLVGTGNSRSDFRLLLRDLLSHHSFLKRTNVGIIEVRSSGGQRSLRCFNAAFGSGNHRGLLLRSCNGLFSLTFGNGSGRGQACIGIPVELREFQ